MIDIATPRLILRLVPLAGLAATAARDVGAASRVISPTLNSEWFDMDWVAGLRQRQWQDDAQYAPWSIRAITLKSTGEVVGSINCHDRPKPFRYNDAEGLAVELGYTLFSSWRRMGYASEAFAAIAAFAAKSDVRWIVLSISPDNEPSQALAKKMGAYKVGSHIDEIDGPEDILLLEL